MNPNDGKLKLVIGNRNYSSWSLRVWLWMRQRGLVFDVVRVPLFVDQNEVIKVDTRSREYVSRVK